MNKCSFQKLCDECAETDTLVEPDSCNEEVQAIYNIPNRSKIAHGVCDNHYHAAEVEGMGRRDFPLCFGKKCMEKKHEMHKEILIYQRDYYKQYQKTPEIKLWQQHCGNCRTCEYWDKEDSEVDGN